MAYLLITAAALFLAWLIWMLMFPYVITVSAGIGAALASASASSVIVPIVLCIVFVAVLVGIAMAFNGGGYYVAPNVVINTPRPYVDPYPHPYYTPSSRSYVVLPTPVYDPNPVYHADPLVHRHPSQQPGHRGQHVEVEGNVRLHPSRMFSPPIRQPVGQHYGPTVHQHREPNMHQHPGANPHGAQPGTSTHRHPKLER